MARENRVIFAGVLILIVGAITVAAGAMITLNNDCQSGFWDQLLVYPDAQRISEDSQFLGEQRVIYRTSDPTALVNEWYTAQRTQQLRSMTESGNFADLTPGNWVVEAAADGGTTITFHTVCP